MREIKGFSVCSERFGQFKQADAVAAFDEDVVAFGMLLGYRRFYLGDILELSVGAVDGGKLASHEPYHIDAARAEEVDHLLMLLAAHGSQFAHVAEDGHLGRYLHVAEVAQGSIHARGVGIVGIDDETVVGGDGELRTVVARYVARQGMVDLLLAYAEIQSDGCCRQHVVEVVASDKMCLHLMPFAVSVVPVHAQHGSTGDDLAAGAEVGAVAHAVSHLAQIAGDALQVLIVGIDEDDAAGAGAEEIVELTLGVHHTLKRPKSLEMCPSHIGDDATVGLDDVHQRADFSRVVGAHLHDGDVVVAGEL